MYMYSCLCQVRLVLIFIIVLSDKISRIIGFVNCFLRVPAVVQKIRAISIYEVFCISIIITASTSYLFGPFSSHKYIQRSPLFCAKHS